MSLKVWFRSKDVVARFGGVIGRDKVISLMKENIIPSFWVGRSLCTTEAAIEEFESMILEADKPIEFKDAQGRPIVTVVPQRFVRGN